MIGLSKNTVLFDEFNVHSFAQVSLLSSPLSPSMHDYPIFRSLTRSTLSLSLLIPFQKLFCETARFFWTDVFTRFFTTGVLDFSENGVFKYAMGNLPDKYFDPSANQTFDYIGNFYFILYNFFSFYSKLFRFIPLKPSSILCFFSFLQV